ncbi:MAG TPA: hypothetical protein VGC41_26590 [Kofleriaceae bacterium]
MQLLLAMHVRERFHLRTYIGLSLAGLGCGFVGAMGGAKIASVAMPVREPVTMVAPQIEVTDDVAISSSTSMRAEAAPAPSNEVAFVIQAEDTNYMILPIDAATLPHVKSRMVNEEYASTTIAPLHAKDLTREVRAWQGVDVLVDNTCRATLHDFAVIHTLTGDPAYAADETANDAKWTRASIEKNGAAFVVAKLETCSGTYARAASAPAAVKFENLGTDQQSAEELAAIQDLESSSVAAEARTGFAEQVTEGNMGGSTNFDEVTHFTAQTARDNRTDTSWIVVRGAADFMCGGPDVNIWGLYRIDHGKPTRIVAAKSKLAGIDSLVDLDGDGLPEILGSELLSTTSFYDRDQNDLVSYQIPFFGCPC